MAGHSHYKKKHSHRDHHHDHDHHHNHDHDHIELNESANARGVECDAHVAMGLEQNLRAIHSPATDDAVRAYPLVGAKKGQDDANATIVLGLPSAQDPKSDAVKKINTLILECGILSHSLIIGLALGITADSTFLSLLVAISFHQLFEGMALGVLVSDTNLSWTSKLILGGLYPITTPVGIAIGILLHQSYTNSPSMILAQGILSSMSAGILIYNTYCELVGGEINHNPAFDRFEQGFKVLCFMFMYLGAFAMALVGVWA